MRIRNGSAGLNVEIDGDDTAPPVVLLHGIIMSAPTWDWMVPHLADRYRVIRLDFRGHGESDRTPDRYQPADYVSDAIAVCEQVAQRPVAMIGHSLGGGTAAALAQLRPDLVRGVLLEDPPLSMPARTEGPTNALLDGFALMRKSIPAMQEAGTDVDTLTAILTAAPSASGGTFGELLYTDGIRAMAASMLRVDATVLDPVLAGTMTPAFDPMLEIPVPVTVLGADPTSPDAVVRQADLDQLSSASPHADGRVLVGSSHLMHDLLTHRDDFWAIVAVFLDSLGAPA